MSLENKSKDKSSLKDFNEQMKLIKQFSIKVQYTKVKSPLYDIEKPIQYQ
jgi:hypothetical protein